MTSPRLQPTLSVDARHHLSRLVLADRALPRGAAGAAAAAAAPGGGRRQGGGGAPDGAGGERPPGGPRRGRGPPQRPPRPVAPGDGTPPKEALSSSLVPDQRQALFEYRLRQRSYTSAGGASSAQLQHGSGTADRGALPHALVSPYPDVMLHWHAEHRALRPSMHCLADHHARGHSGGEVAAHSSYPYVHCMQPTAQRCSPERA
jgi:hypothetical protein